MSDHSLLIDGSSGSLPVSVAVVEDDPAVLELVTTFLDEENINVEVCPLGWHAHRFIRQNRPDVVILGVQMPSVNGIQLFYLLRADQTTASIPVIFLTANPKKVHYELPNYEEMGAVVLPKPFDLQQLLDLIQAVAAA